MQEIPKYDNGGSIMIDVQQIIIQFKMILKWDVKREFKTNIILSLQHEHIENKL